MDTKRTKLFNINFLIYSQAEIKRTLRKFLLLLYFTKFLKCDNIDTLHLRMLEKHNKLNFNFTILVSSRAKIVGPMLGKFIPRLHFVKPIKHGNI